MAYIKGNFRKYIFKSDNGYVVGLFKVRDTDPSLLEYKNQTITFTGYFSDLNDIDLYLLNGEFVNHERYGKQFITDAYQTVMPEEKDNIIEFLSSDIFPGIGEKKASLIVEHLGTKVLSMILKDKSVLLSVPTVTEKQMNKIYDNLYKYQNNYETIVNLSKFGFSTKDSLSIYRTYSSESINVLNDNPYSLIDEIPEITFNKIDNLRNNFKIDDLSLIRVEAIIKYVLKELSFRTGNTYFNKDEIIYYVKNIINKEIDISLIESSISNLIEKEVITLINDKYFLTETYEMEKYIADRLYRIGNIEENIKIEDQDILDLEKDFNIKFNKEQISAIINSFKTKCAVITGGPGVGKTTIIKAITNLYKNINKYSTDKLVSNLALLAPTGRASKRISEQTNLPAYTIHRFLKWNKEDNTFSVNENNPSKVKFIIIDESSMIDTYLLYNLLLGIDFDTKILFIGDYNQLPSVGPGQIFKDIIESDVINISYLKKLYRREEGSNISIFANNILNNEINKDIFNENEDLTFIECTSLELKSKLKEFIITYKDLDINKLQVLAPIYKGDNGIDDLNYYMQDILNPKDNKKNEVLVDGVFIRKDDKVLQLTNVIDENIFNGDIGKVLNINNNPKEIYIDYDSNLTTIKPNNFNNIKLGYAISIHKSQGSEFDIIIMPILNKYSSMLYKKLLYTGVTRAKKKLILLGEFSALDKSIHNDRESNRKTYLKTLLIECIK